MRTLILAICLVIVETSGAVAQSDVPIPDGVPPAAFWETLELLGNVLRPSNPDAAALEIDSRDLGEGLYVVRVMIPDSYPGTGVAAVVMTLDGARYGMHGERDLAELFRERGWLTAPAPSELLLDLLDAAYFEGMGSTTLTPPGAVVSANGLTLEFSQFTPPGPAFEWQAVFPAEGATQLYTIDNSAEGDGLRMRQVR